MERVLAFLASEVYPHVLIVSAVFVIVSCRLFCGGRPLADRVRSCAQFCVLSPAVYVFCGHCVYRLLSLVRVAAVPEELLFAVRIVVVSLINVLFFQLTWRAFRTVTGRSRRLSFVVFSSFAIAAVVPLVLDSRVTQLVTSLFLLAFLVALSVREFAFLSKHDGELVYRHFTLQTALTYLLVIGCMVGVDFSKVQMTQETYAWSCVIAVFFALLVFLLNRMTLLGMREKYEAVQSERKISSMNDTMGRVLDPRVRDYLLSKRPELGGTAVEVTVLFCDIRGFTTMSERLPPQQLITMLNRYFSAMATCITGNQGVINKYIGDAIMAIFGAPEQSETHARDALSAAQEMQERLSALNDAFAAEGLPRLSIGIGLNTGEAIAGTIGADERMEYTVIGDTVNTASRIEGLCKTYGRPLLIAQSTVTRLDRPERCVFVADSDIRGRQGKVRLYTV